MNFNWIVFLLLASLSAYTQHGSEDAFGVKAAKATQLVSLDISSIQLDLDDVDDQTAYSNNEEVKSPCVLIQSSSDDADFYQVIFFHFIRGPPL
uniref:hypothetical protein n=1 Tax=Ningiella ruwaisensis TaxID=2364274 RepID=UPI00109FCBCE|nr:hypothetical protein [Ningiella ruwaisensis]